MDKPVNTNPFGERVFPLPLLFPPLPSFSLFLRLKAVPQIKVRDLGERCQPPFPTAKRPTSWNSSPDSLKDINLTLQAFKRHLNTFLFSTY